MTGLEVKAFEFSQTLREQWLMADYATKRRILEIVLSNCSLDGVTICPTIRKPFDVLAEGLVSKQKGGNRTPIELFLAGMRELNREIGRKIIVSRLDSERFQFRGNSIAAGRM